MAPPSNRHRLTIRLSGRVDLYRGGEPTPADDALDAQMRARLQSRLEVLLAGIEHEMNRRDLQAEQRHLLRARPLGLPPIPLARRLATEIVGRDAEA